VPPEVAIRHLDKRAACAQTLQGQIMKVKNAIETLRRKFRILIGLGGLMSVMMA